MIRQQQVQQKLAKLKKNQKFFFKNEQAYKSQKARATNWNDLL